MKRLGLTADERYRKGAATRLGMTLEEYDNRLSSGERWCSGCRQWQPECDFYRGDAAECKTVRRERKRAAREHEWQAFRNWLLARVLVK